MKVKTLKKQMVFIGLILSMMTSLLVGCSTRNEEKKASQSTEAAKVPVGTEKPVEIEFLHIWPEYRELFDKEIANFEKEHPNIKINTTVIPWNELTQTLQISFAAGNAPDVTVAWLDRMGGFKAINACLDLTPYMTADNNAWKNSLVESAVSLGTVGDEIYGVPFRSTATVLAYNKTILENNGWEVPTTLEEFEALNDQVVAKGITPLLTPGNPEGFQLSSLAMTFIEHELYKSGKIQTEEYLTGYMSDVADEYAAGVARTREWMNKGWIGKDSLAIKREEAQAQFYTQKGLFFFANNNEIMTLRESAKEAGFEIGFIGFPAPEGSPMILYKLGVDGFFVKQSTAYPDECVEFLKYLTSIEVQQKWADETLSAMANVNVQYKDLDLANMANILSEGKSFRIKFPYSQGSLLTEESVEIANFIADSNMSPQALGEKIQNMKQTCIEENGGR